MMKDIMFEINNKINKWKNFMKILIFITSYKEDIKIFKCYKNNFQFASVFTYSEEFISCME